MQRFSCFILFWIASKVILRQYAINLSLFGLCDLWFVLVWPIYPANYKLCFLSEEKLFSFIVDLNKTIPAAFILRLVNHLEKQN